MTSWTGIKKRKNGGRGGKGSKMKIQATTGNKYRRIGTESKSYQIKKSKWMTTEGWRIFSCNPNTSVASVTIILNKEYTYTRKGNRKLNIYIEHILSGNNWKNNFHYQEFNIQSQIFSLSEGQTYHFLFILVRIKSGMSSRFRFCKYL